MKRATEDKNYERESAKAAAKRLGLAPFFATDYVLMLDIDTYEAWRAFNERLWPKFVEAAQGVHFPRLITKSKSGGWHVYVRLPEPKSQKERIAMHRALGSDPKREALHDAAEDGETKAVALFETATEAPHVVAWLAANGSEP